MLSLRARPYYNVIRSVKRVGEQNYERVCINVLTSRLHECALEPTYKPGGRNKQSNGLFECARDVVRTRIVRVPRFLFSFNELFFFFFDRFSSILTTTYRGAFGASVFSRSIFVRRRTYKMYLNLYYKRSRNILRLRRCLAIINNDINAE